jgi:hypothetical protein
MMPVFACKISSFKNTKIRANTMTMGGSTFTVESQTAKRVGLRSKIKTYIGFLDMNSRLQYNMADYDVFTIRVQL